MNDQIITVEDLVKRFGDLVAVDHIGFQVFSGEIFGFLGPNGAGKTTTINILCTLTKPTSGRAVVNGFDVVRQQSQVRQSIGLVFQDPSLDDRLSGWQNLHFHAVVYNIPPSVREKRIEEVLRMTELWEKRNGAVRFYSGGMKRRLELARGLLHHPQVLFLDEPTIGLDPQTRNRLWEYILEIRKRERTTIFLTTHYMDEAEHADRIAIMDYGKIVALDKPERLKHLVGKDIISLKTEDNDQAVEEIRQRYQVEARLDDNELRFEVAKGEKFLPTLIKEFNTKILSLSLRHPSLDDVFLKLTGREMREEQASNSLKAVVSHHSQRMRR
jgi:ABC-2 type transport system ATP-binding protein